MIGKKGEFLQIAKVRSKKKSMTNIQVENEGEEV